MQENLTEAVACPAPQGAPASLWTVLSSSASLGSRLFPVWKGDLERKRTGEGVRRPQVLTSAGPSETRCPHLWNDTMVSVTYKGISLPDKQGHFAVELQDPGPE